MMENGCRRFWFVLKSQYAPISKEYQALGMNGGTYKARQYVHKPGCKTQPCGDHNNRSDSTKALDGTRTRQKAPGPAKVLKHV
jgi:hypothetical protein